MRTTATTCACEGIGYDVKNVMSIDEPQRLCVDLSVCLRRTGAWIRAILNASRRYGHLPSRRERTQRLVQIERAISRGDSIKSAVGQAGISEQTYYQRKKAAAPAAAAGLAVTPLNASSIPVNLRSSQANAQLPPLPDVEFVAHVRPGLSEETTLLARSVIEWITANRPGGSPVSQKGR